MRGLAGRVAAKGIRSWMSTIRFESLHRQPSADPAHPDCQPSIFVHWHEYMLTPLYLRGNCHVAILVSQHRDADILESFAKHSGFDCVRGSSYRGGVSALRDLMERGKHQHMVITPDGPRGPRRTMSPGAIYIASKLGRPITPLGLSYDNAWRANSWDKFALPMPFSTSRNIMGDPIFIPPNLSRAGIEEHRLTVEAKINELTDEAEAWAKSRKSNPNSVRSTRPRKLIPPIKIIQAPESKASTEDSNEVSAREAA